AGGAGGGGANRLEGMRERLVQNYKLDKAQQRKLDAILQESRSQFARLQGVPEQERQTRTQNNREATRMKIREILTDEQRARFDAEGAVAAAGGGGRGGRGATAGRVWVQGPDGKLQPVQLMLGISDGSSTEVVAGELKEGQDVVMGVVGAQGPRTPASGGSGGPRLRI
ncbi:MAG TPA: hypothetical protein VGQ77_05960, partial [Methylomirabilota bacterium]|nr:hypothetical protein [Methylomirabilota bacterium]